MYVCCEQWRLSKFQSAFMMLPSLPHRWSNHQSVPPARLLPCFVVLSWDRVSVSKASIKAIAVGWVVMPLRELTCHTVLPAIVQRWHSRLYPSKAGTQFSDHGRMQGWVDLVGYIPRWYTCPKTVTHPSTDRAQCGLTSFMHHTLLTTTPCHHPVL